MSSYVEYDNMMYDKVTHECVCLYFHGIDNNDALPLDEISPDVTKLFAYSHNFTDQDYKKIFLKFQNIALLDISQCFVFEINSDISLLKKTLRELRIRDNDILDLSPVRSLRNLETLIMSDNPIIDLIPLNSLKKLKYIDFDSCRIRELTPLTGLKKLECVFADRNPIQGTRPYECLVSCKKLKSLYIWDIPETSFKGIPENVMVYRNDSLCLCDFMSIPCFECVMRFEEIWELSGSSKFSKLGELRERKCSHISWLDMTSLEFLYIFF